MGQTTLRTDRLLLVPLADAHLELEVELDADPEVMRYLGAVHTREQVEALHRRRTARARQAPGLGYWVGLVDEEPVGWWLLAPPSRADQGPADGSAELGYRLLRRRWRQGLAVEGSRGLLRHAFEDLGLQRVFAETMAVNTASRATMAALGMTHTRDLVLAFDEPLPGAEHGEVSYEISRQQWFAR